MTTQAISQWNLDPTHSEVQFKVRHLVISTVTGTFRNFSASLEKAGEDFNGAKVSFTAHVDSIDTNQADRDNHLKSPEFFDAAQFPTIEFVSSSFEKSSDNTYTVKGNLTMKGITREVE